MDCEEARLAGAELKWPHATTVKFPQQSHIYNQLRGASNPGSGIGKDFKGPNI